MKIRISFKNIEHTESIDNRIREKTEKLKKYFDGRIDVSWTCYVNETSDHDRSHVADVRLSGPQFEYHANATSDSMYKTIDKVLNKVETQIKKKKEKWKDHIHNKHKDAYKGSEDDDSTNYGEGYVETMFKEVESK